MTKEEMIKKTTIRTNEDKAKLIASNLTLDSKGFNDDGVLTFECYVDAVVYTVVKVEIFEGISFSKDDTRTFFSDVDAAKQFYCEECEYLKKYSDDDDYAGKVTIAFIENKLSFNVTISIEDLNISALADMFDEHLFKYSEIFSKTQADFRLTER